MGLIIWSGASAKPLRDVIGPIVARANIPYVIASDITKLPPSQEGDVVLVCGTKAMLLLQGLGLIQKGRTVTSSREKVVTLMGVSYLVTFDPEICSRDYARKPEIQWDTQLAIRLCVTKTIEPVLGVSRYVESFHELIERVEEKYAKTNQPVNVACDLETKGLNPYDPEAWIIIVSFTVDKGASDVMYFEKRESPKEPDVPWEPDGGYTYWEGLWNQLHWLLTTRKISLRGANFKFDSNFIFQKWGIYCTNLKFDTMLVGSLLDENRSNSLKLHAKLFTDSGGYEQGLVGYDMGFMELVPKPLALKYGGADTDVTYQVADRFKADLLKDRQLTNFYVKIMQPASRVFEKMERVGALVDVDYYHRLQTDVNAEIDRLRLDMLGCVPNKLRIKYKDSIHKADVDGKSPFKPALLKEFLFSPAGLNLKPKMYTEGSYEKGGKKLKPEADRVPSTAMDHLLMFDDNPDAAKFIGLFKELGSAQKTMSTYITGFLKHLRPDGRFHGTYMLHRGEYGGDDEDSGAVTGRTSCKDPALQTLPKRTIWSKRLRKAFIAPEGYSILQLDFSQGELRITAVVANEPTMIKAYGSGADLHAITAAQLNGYTMEEFLLLPEDTRDALRSGGKAGNFGLIYGMGAGGYKEYAHSSYGVTLSMEQATAQREAFFDLYQALPKWHEEYRALAHANGYVRSPLGRIRHLPLINAKDQDIVAQAERQAVNSPIQSCLSDMMQLAMVLIDREYGDQDLNMFLMCHDSIAFYCKTDDVEIWAQKIKTLMENLPLEKDFGFVSPLKFYADAEFGPNLAELKKLKNLK